MPKVIPTTPTGSEKLDKALGTVCPGLALGTITEIMCTAGCGATAICLAAAKAATLKGDHVVYVDSDNGLSEDRLEAADIDSLLFSIVSGDVLTDSTTTLIHGHARHGTRLVIIDSVNALNAGVRSLSVKELVKAIDGTGTAVLLVRRTASVVDENPWLELQHAESRRFRLLWRRDQDSDGEHNDSFVRVEVLKDRFGKAMGKSVELRLQDGVLVDGPRRKKSPKQGASRFDRDDVI